jgi:hypothetical protein
VIRLQIRLQRNRVQTPVFGLMDSNLVFQFLDPGCF